MGGCDLFAPKLDPVTVPKPTIEPSGRTLYRPVMVNITGPVGASVHFTLDGSTPTTASLRYEEPFYLDSAATIKAIAAVEGGASDPATATFAWAGGTGLAAPAFSPAATQFPFNTTILQPTWVQIGGPPGAAIYYTISDQFAGVEPTTASTLYASPIYVAPPINTYTTIRAIAVKNGVASAETLSRYYYNLTVNSPSFQPPAYSEQIGAFQVTLYDNGASEVFYTLDESDPRDTANENRMLYSAPFYVNFDVDARPSGTYTGKIVVKAAGFIGVLPPSYTNTATYSKIALEPIAEAFWGSWQAIGRDEVWYIGRDGVLVNGTLRKHSAADPTSVSFDAGQQLLDGTLWNETPVDPHPNQLKFEFDSGESALFLYRSAGATNSFSAGVKDTTPDPPSKRLFGRASGKGLTGLGGIQVILRNQRNPADVHNYIFTNDDGTFSASGTVVGDEYSVTIPVQTKIPKMLQTRVTPLYDGQDLGRVDLNNTGANFKIDIKTDALPDRMRADGVTPIRYQLYVRNLGEADLDEANYRITSPDGLIVVPESYSDPASGILGTVFRGGYKMLTIDLVAMPIAGEYEDKRLTVEITDGLGLQSWSDTVTLRYLKKEREFTIYLSNYNIYLPGLLIDPDGKPYRVDVGTTTFSWKQGPYLLALSKSQGNYYIGLDAPLPYLYWSGPWDHGSVVDDTEPLNDSADTTKAVLPYGSISLKALTSVDTVDFYRFVIPAGFLDISHTRTPRAADGTWSAVLYPSEPDLLPKTRYTTDGSDPESSATAVEYLGGTLNLGAEVEYLKAYTYLDGYQGASRTFAAPPRMANILAGSFTRGGYQIDLGAFTMAETEVTQALYETVMGVNPSEYKSGPDYPVETVSWYAAVAFCNRLSILEGLQPAYSLGGVTDPDLWGAPPGANSAQWNSIVMNPVPTDPNARGYRLPTEAEWEFAYRATTTTPFYWGIASIDNAGGRHHPVGLKTANLWGLFDMAGNVAEWCWDWWDSSYPAMSLTNPTGPIEGTRRVNRSGHYYGSGSATSATSKGLNEPYIDDWMTGFRVVRP